MSRTLGTAGTPVRLRLRRALVAVVTAAWMMLGPSGAYAQMDTPATAQEDPPGSIEKFPSDFDGYPRLDGGWDIFLETTIDGGVEKYGGSLAFSPPDFYLLGQIVDPETDRLISNFGVFEGTYSYVNPRRGAATWKVHNPIDDTDDVMTARFLSEDAAIVEFRGKDTSSRVQRFIIVHTNCDFRFGGESRPEIEGCRWLKLPDGEMQAYARLSGECRELGPCYRLVSDLYYLIASDEP